MTNSILAALPMSAEDLTSYLAVAVLAAQQGLTWYQKRREILREQALADAKAMESTWQAKAQACEKQVSLQEVTIRQLEQLVKLLRDEITQLRSEQEPTP